MRCISVLLLVKVDAQNAAAQSRGRALSNKPTRCSKMWEQKPSYLLILKQVKLDSNELLSICPNGCAITHLYVIRTWYIFLLNILLFNRHQNWHGFAEMPQYHDKYNRYANALS